VPNSPTRNDPDYGNVAFPDGTYFGGPSATPESYMDTPVVNGIAYPVMKVDPKAYRVRFLNGANDRYWNLSLWVADDTPAVVAAAGRPGTEVKMVNADGTAKYKLADGTIYAPNDGRVGGVPDPLTAGPNIIRFANEGGLLAAPVVHAPSPMNGYNDPLAGFTLVRDAGANFYLGGAERADTVIDFSQYAGKTLILYNDSSAPVPGGDPRYDYYTGDPDQTTSGGAPTTLPGYGPNTRTVMQIVVAPLAAGATVTAYDPLGNGGALAAELPKAYAASADAHIVASGTVPTAVSAAKSNMTLNGVTVPLKVKTIQGYTDPNFGRLIAQIGTELQTDPLTGAANTNNAATPLGYIDTPTDIISDGETQYWWIKNNDVDNHPMHFHLFNVQVVARVDHFNNALIYPPQPDETGWKETVKNWPLEDVIVAIKPKTPALPFGLPKSVRNLDPTLPTGASNSSFNRPGADLVSAFFQNDVVTGAPIAGGVKNSSNDFDWEYVWHCHILGHEENDLMRPLVFHPVPPTQPAAPGVVAVSATGLVTWTDPTPALDPLTKGNPANEIGFRVERATVTTNNATATPTVGTFAALVVPASTVVDGRVNTLSNATSFQDAPAPYTDYQYKVVSVNEGFTGPSLPVNLKQTSAPPLTALASAPAATPAKWSVTLGWQDTATNLTSHMVKRATGTINQLTGVPTWSAFASKPAATSVLAANLATFIDGPVGVTAQTLYKYEVYALNGTSVGPATSAIVATAANLGAAPNQLQATGAPTKTSVGIQWQNTASTLATGYEVQMCQGVAGVCSLTSPWAPVPGTMTLGGANGTQFVATGLTGKTSYVFRVRAVNNLVPMATKADPGLVSPWSKVFTTKTL
jgi:FtsP/CotA-like multicopper oxidase with cupredoxin domain